MITIRTYRPEDRETVEHICVATATGIFSWRIMRRAALEIYCRYYLDREPDSCFVACNEENIPVGYMLCAENCGRWSPLFREHYLAGLKNPLARTAAAASLKMPEKYVADYPAHLHVDILPAYQRRGIGTRLFAELRSRLTREGVPGVMLSAGADNENAIRFYENLGFQILEKNSLNVVMGLHLNG